MLLQLIAEGDEKAFSRLFHCYSHQLGAFIYSITRSMELSEEIVNNVFLKIWKEREKLVTIEKFPSYLFVITRNLTFNAIRNLANQKKRQVIFEDYPVAFDVNDEHDEEIDYSLLLDHAVTKLPPRQKQVFSLKRKGLKNAEVASIMNISQNSVKKYQQWSIQAISGFLKKTLS